MDDRNFNAENVERHEFHETGRNINHGGTEITELANPESQSLTTDEHG